jgi:hypothetical protein
MSGAEQVQPELLEFAASVMEREGGLTESSQDALDAILPDDLARDLELPSAVRIGAGGVPLLYGLPLLDRLVERACREVPVAYGRLNVRYLKKEGFENLLGQDITLVNTRAKVTGRAEARTTYMVLAARYVALSDERKDGLVLMGLSEASGAEVPGLVEGWPGFEPHFFAPGEVPTHFPIRLEQVVKQGLRAAKRRVEDELTPFIASTERRLRRDTASTREYYEALAREMGEGLSRAGLAPGQRAEREAKIAELPAETARKVDDLTNKYRIQVRITAQAALRLLVPVAQVMLGVHHRRFRQQLRLVWNPVTRALDPMACAFCGCTVRRIYFRDNDPDVRPACETCSGVNVKERRDASFR